MTNRTPRRWAPRRASRQAPWGAPLAALVLGGALVVPAPAGALPPDGPGADTPGTSSSVSPRRLEAGATLSFSVAGFPAGEVVYVKIDDGAECDAAAVHGACVYHQQRIGSDGRVSGSFALPTSLRPGAHWLRFLASEELVDADGTYLGVKGYTHRGGAGFTVVAAARAEPTAARPSRQPGRDGTSGEGTRDEPTPEQPAPGGEATDPAAAPVAPSGSPAPAATGATSPATATAGPTASAAPAADEVAPTGPAAVAALPADGADAAHVPWVGLGSLAGALTVGGALGLRARRR